MSRSERAGARSEGFAAVGVEEKAGDFGTQAGRVSYANSGIGREPLADNGLEVLHVRPEDDRLASHDGFNGVLAARGSQALTDEDDGGEVVPVAQFTGSVDEQNVGTRCVCDAGWLACVGEEVRRLMRRSR